MKKQFIKCRLGETQQNNSHSEALAEESHGTLCPCDSSPVGFRMTMQHQKGFTLAEVLITLVIIGVIAAITIPMLIAKYNEERTVAKVKKIYSIVNQAVQKFQIDNACTGSIANCFTNEESNQNSLFMNRFIKNFNYVKLIQNGENVSNANWLPDKAYNLNNTQSTRCFIGIYKAQCGCCPYFTLADGTILHVELPDTNRQSGYIFFDTNGKQGPNRIGKDQFVIGIGAYNNSKYANKVHPYYNEDGGSVLEGLCNVSGNHECNPDICTTTNCSPTAYVLKYNKLPPL